MANMKEIKKRIKSVSDTSEIVNAMYLTSSAKLASGRVTLSKTELWFNALSKEMNIIAPFVSDNKFVKERTGKIIYLLIGGEKGLAGDFSKNVVKKYLSSVKSENVDLLVIGASVKKYCNSKKLNFNEDFDFSVKKPDFKLASMICSYLVERYENEEISKIILIYNDFDRSGASVTSKQFLPVSFTDKSVVDFTFFPDKSVICDEVINQYLNGFIYNAINKSYCGEQYSRMVAMDNANQNAQKLLDELTVQYNHQRQNNITSEITEISSGSRNY